MAEISKDILEMSNQPWFPKMMSELGYEKIRYGRWIEDEYGILRCSECQHGKVYKTNYCPNCGAKMDGGENDN